MVYFQLLRIPVSQNSRVPGFYYFREYDGEKEFARMKAAGIFQSVRPDDSVGEGW